MCPAVRTSPRAVVVGLPRGDEGVRRHLLRPRRPDRVGFWHWTVTDLDASVTELPTDAGNPEADLLPAGAVTLKNDAGEPRFVGAAPPEGHGPHRYYFIVTALSEPLGIDESASPAYAGFNMYFKGIGRAWLECTYEAG